MLYQLISSEQRRVGNYPDCICIVELISRERNGIMSNYMTYFTMTVIIVTIARIIMIYIEDIYMKYLNRKHKI